MHEEYEVYLKSHIDMIEAERKKLLQHILGSAAETVQEEMKPITPRRNFRDIQRELEMSHKNKETKEQVNG